MKRHLTQTLYFGLPVAAFILIFLGLSRNFETSNTFNLIFAAIVTGVVIWILPTMDERHIGGKKLLSAAEAVQEARERMRQDYPSDKGFPLWDLFTVPSEYKSTGIYVLGEMGSGKTVYLMYLIEKALQDNPNAKFVIHDYKMDIHPFLTRHLKMPAAEIKILHPFDQRCCGWDMQADIEDEGNAESIANALIPDPPPQADPFWNINARLLVTAGILFFFYKAEEEPGYRWGLRELVDLLEDGDALKVIINADPRLRFAKEAINRKNNDILTTVLSYIGGLRRIANLWAFPDKELVSLKKWRAEKKRGVLILGFEENEEDACKTLNRVLWKQLQKEVLRKNLPPHETWFFLDEFYLMSKLDGIEKFSSVSRSFKGNLVLATQDIAQVKKTYGEDTLNILMQGLKTQIYFRCKGNASQWAVTQIGEQKVLKESQSKSVSSGNVSSGTGLREQREKLLMAEDIQRLKKCTAERPLLEAVISSFIDDPFRYTMTFDAFRSVWPTPKIEPDFSLEDRRARTRPRPLTIEERERLGIFRGREKEEESASGFEAEV